jgi:hypothetical protein
MVGIKVFHLVICSSYVLMQKFTPEDINIFFYYTLSITTDHIRKVEKILR